MGSLGRNCCIFRLKHVADLGASLSLTRDLRIPSVITNQSEQTRHFESGDKQEQQQQDTSSSSFHQQFHRSSYERKRTSYQEERHKQNHTNRTTPLMATRNTNHYERLRLEQGADPAAIKAAYYSLSKQYHPDIAGQHDPDAAENFRLITESYDVLSDSKSRAEYDSSLVPSPSQAPTFTAWHPSRPDQNLESEHIYRMREAGRIFRSKQEAALEREKLLNPQKFRAGTFKRDHQASIEHRRDAGRMYANLTHRLQSLREAEAMSNFNSSSNQGQDAGQNFYRMHLIDATIRRQKDIQDSARIYGSETRQQDSAALAVSLLGIAAIFGLAFLSLLAKIYNWDLPAYLDSRVQVKLSPAKSRDSVERMDVD